MRNGEAVDYLFSYGTLQQPEVQVSNFGRLLDGAADAIVGYRLDWVVITDPEVIAVSGSDRHPIVRHTAQAADRVAGTVFAVTPQELVAADEYEVDDYSRVRVTLASGLASWVYLAASEA
jgi:hypothetical protein